jgi:hypothetical protein
VRPQSSGRLLCLFVERSRVVFITGHAAFEHPKRDHCQEYFNAQKFTFDAGRNPKAFMREDEARNLTTKEAAPGINVRPSIKGGSDEA